MQIFADLLFPIRTVMTVGWTLVAVLDQIHIEYSFQKIIFYKKTTNMNMFICIHEHWGY